MIRPTLLSLSLLFTACTSDEAMHDDVPCTELLSVIEECEGDECGSPENRELFESCEGESDDTKSDGIKSWLLSSLASQAQTCWDNNDSGCMWVVYRSLAAGAYAAGLPAAGRNLNNYLSCGGNLQMQESAFMADSDFLDEYEDNIYKAQKAAKWIPTGTSQTREYRAQMESYGALEPALGRYALTSTVVVYNHSESWNHVSVQFSVYDRYDWHGDQGFQVGGARNGSYFKDKWAELTKQAGSCEFDITANWTTELWVEK